MFIVLGVKNFYLEDLQLLQNSQYEFLGIMFSKFDKWDCSILQRKTEHFFPFGWTLSHELQDNILEGLFSKFNPVLEGLFSKYN